MSSQTRLADPDELAAEARVAPRVPLWERDVKIPFFTTGLLLLLFLIFSAEQYFEPSVTTGFDVGGSTLTALGALDALLAGGQGEWWRVATAPFLHASFVHIVSNGVVLLLIGAVLEKLIGRAWMAATFVVCAFAGAAAALLMNPPDLPTVGASGGIIGLIAAAFVVSFHPACRAWRWWLRGFAVLLAVPALIPTASTPGQPSVIDFSSHLGGSIAGALMGFIMQAVWPEDAPRPRFPGMAANFAAAGFGAVAAAFALVALNYPAYAAREHLLITAADFPRSEADGQSRSAALVLAYPHDPRAHLYRAAWFEGQGDFADAEQEVRTALADPETTALGFPAAFQMRMRYDLAILLVQQARYDDAKIAAQPLCEDVPAELAGARARLKAAGLCGTRQLDPAPRT